MTTSGTRRHWMSGDGRRIQVGVGLWGETDVGRNRYHGHASGATRLDAAVDEDVQPAACNAISSGYAYLSRKLAIGSLRGGGEALVAQAHPEDRRHCREDPKEGACEGRSQLSPCCSASS